MKKLFQLLTLKAFSVSTHRKRQFVLTAFLLAGVLFFKKFNQSLIVDIPYAVKVLEVITYTLITNVTINAIRIFVVSSHRERREISNEEHDNFTVGVNAIVNVTTVLATIVFIFIVFDIEFRSFLTSIAIFAVTLTLIFQDFIKNFLFGLNIMFAADYEIGDYIQVADMPKGVILNITFSCVQLKTESGNVLYIPNTVVQGNQIINFSKLRPRRISTEFILLRSQFKSVIVLEARLRTRLEEEYPGVFDIDKCYVFIKTSELDCITCVLETSSKKASLKLKEQLNHSVQRFAVEYKG